MSFGYSSKKINSSNLEMADKLVQKSSELPKEDTPVLSEEASKEGGENPGKKAQKKLEKE